MLPPLIGEKLVHGAEGGGVCSSDADLATAGKRMILVADYGLALGHHSGAGDVFGVHESWSVEISRCKRTRDPAEVRPDLFRSDAVIRIPPQLDPAAIGERLEDVA